MTERHLSCERRYAALAAIFLGIVCYSGGPLFAIDWSAPSGTLDYKMVSLAHISPERGKELLTQLGIGTVSRMPGTNSLLITAETGELRKAVAVLGIVDASQEYSIQRLGPATLAAKLPSNDRIADAVGNMVIGTFAHPPRSTSKTKALIDTHGGVVWAIAPLFQLQDIKVAIELGPDVLKQRKEGTHDAQTGPAAPTLQAADMAEPSAGGKTPQGDRILTAEAGERITLPKDVQERLQQLQQRAAEAQAKPPSALRTETQPAAPASDSRTQPETPATQPGTPVTPPATQPAPAPVSEPAPAQSPSALGQSDTQSATPSEPNTPQKITENPAGTPEAQEPPTPAPSEQPSLQPGQIVPPEPGQSPESRSPLEAATPKIEVTTPEPKATDAEVKAAAPELKAASTPPQTASASSLYEPAEFPNGDRVINLTLPEKLPVIQLLDLVGKYLNLSYVYDPAKVMGEVTVKLNGNLQGQMKVKDLYLLLESVLQFKDLVMTRHKDNVVKIVPKAEAMTIDPQLVSPESRTINAGDSIVSRVFTLKHIDTTSADNLLQQMGLSVGVTSIAESGTLIVTAYAHRMARIEYLLSLVDKPGEPRLFKFRQLRYTMAQSLAEKVKALAEQLESVTVTVGEADSMTAATARLPGETEVAWKARVARVRAAQAAAIATRGGPTMPGRSPMAEPKPGVYLDADERTNRILMIGVAEQLETVSLLVDTLDVEQQELRTLELYRIKHVDADEVARKLQDLGIISKLPESTSPGRTTSQSRITGPTITPTPRPGSPTPETPVGVEVTEGGIVGEPQVVVVESTNSLLVNATAEQHAKIASIIEYIDSEMDVGEIPYKIYPLENSTPDHLSEVLESLIQETVEQQNKEGKIEKTVVGREEKIKIVPDPNTYSLVVYASKKNQEWISSLVKQLDKRRPQVLIDVTLVEVTKSDEFNYDLQLIEGWPNLLNPSGQIPSVPASVLDKLKSGEKDRFIEASSTNGTFKGYYADKHISALLTAMQSKNYGRVLAKPKLLVNDNEPGNIKTADITYIEKTSAIPVSSGAAGNQTTLIQTSSDFQEYEAGIEMNITPHISEGDLLRLVIELTRSDFRETVDPKRPPNKTTSEVKTAVTVPDGSTIILGGMIKLNQHKGGSKVPILGDIPLIGGLFRTIKNSDIESKLYVFVKAEVIRPAASLTGGMEDLEKLSEKNRTAFEKHELEFQNYQDWPGVKSKAVRPPKVLDAN